MRVNLLMHKCVN